MNKRELQGRMSAPVEKRYKSFVSMVADREQIWMLVNKNGYVYSDDAHRDYSVWPMREYAELFSEGNEVVSVEVHEFCDWCTKEMASRDTRFLVFPNGNNAFTASAEQLLSDIKEELEMLE